MSEESRAKIVVGIGVHLLSGTGFSTFSLENICFSHTISVLEFRLFLLGKLSAKAFVERRQVVGLRSLDWFSMIHTTID